MKFKRYISFLFLLFVIFFLWKYIDWKLLYKSIINIDIKYLLLGIALSFFCPLVGSARWQKVLSAYDIKINFKRSLNSVMIAFSANLFAPAKSGDFIKVLILNKDFQKTTLTSAVISERLGDLFVLSILALLFGIIIAIPQAIIIGSLISIGIIFSIIIISILNFNFKNKILFNAWYIIKEASIIFLNKPIIMITSMFWSAINWILMSVQVWVFFMAIGVNIKILEVVSLFPLTVLLSLVPLTPGGLGVREAIYIYIFLPFAEAHESLLVSMLYYTSSVGLTALIGTIFIYFYLNKTFNSVTQDKIL